MLQIESFMKSGIELAGGAAAFRSALEKTHNNIKWTKNNYPIIRAWLDEHGSLCFVNVLYK